MNKTIIVILAVTFIVLNSTIAFASSAKETPKKKAIVLAVFGTTYPTALQSILNLKDKVVKAFPNTLVKISFTSEIIRSKWAKRSKDKAWRQKHPEVPEEIYSAKNPLATIANLQDQGFRYIAVQSTHIFAGEEYQNLKAEVEALDSIKALRERHKPFKKIILGRPALGEPGDTYHYTDDIIHAAKILKSDVQKASNNKSALVYMGHGNEVLSTGAYVELQDALRDANPNENIFIGNVEGYPQPKRILNALKQASIKKVTLFPLMVVAGDHASNDMASNEDDSWKTMFESNGIKVIPVLRGLGEVDEWAKIYVKHLKEAMDANHF